MFCYLSLFELFVVVFIVVFFLRNDFIVVLCEYGLFIGAFVNRIDCPECEADRN